MAFVQIELIVQIGPQGKPHQPKRAETRDARKLSFSRKRTKNALNRCLSGSEHKANDAKKDRRARLSGDLPAVGATDRTDLFLLGFCRWLRVTQGVICVTCFGITQHSVCCADFLKRGLCRWIPIYVRMVFLSAFSISTLTVSASALFWMPTLVIPLWVEFIAHSHPHDLL